MADDDPPGPEPSPAAEAISPVPPEPTEKDVSLLTKKNRQVLELRKAGKSYTEISKATKLSRSGVKYQVDSLVMRGYLPPAARDEAPEPETPDEANAAQQQKIIGSTVGASTAAAAKAAAEMAVGTTDIFLKTGEWSWRKFNESARQHGYEDIFSWLEDCVEYWQSERLAWQPTLDALRESEQEVLILRDRVDILNDVGAFRREILEAVVASNFAGKPMTPEQIQVLIFGRAAFISPPGPMPALAPG